MSNYELCCCSTADLNHAWYEHRNIKTVCFHISIDGVEYPDDMDVTITQEKMFTEMLAGKEAHSSQVTTGAYIDFWKPFLEAGKDVFHVTLSSGISGTLNSAMLAKSELESQYPDRRIVVVDSLCGSSGYGMLMDYLADKRDEGYSIDELEKWALENRTRVHHWVLSTDLTFLIKGGRVKPAAGLLGKMLNICPIVELCEDGSLKVREKVRGRKKGLAREIELMEQHADDGLNYSGKCYICHTEEALGQELRRMVEEKFPGVRGKVELLKTGATIAVHLGPGTAVLFFMGDARGN
ncbi:MAG: DegV family protein [Lachnospiraceae bacterium]|nr:DegV family protein [Lachnospiraceae bacterium]